MIVPTEDEKAGSAEQLCLQLDQRAFDRLYGLRYELDLVPPEDFAMAIGVTEHTLSCWRSAGEGPAYTKTGRGVFYRRETIKAWLDKNTTIPTIGTALAA